MEDYEPDNNIYGSRMTQEEIRETLEKHKMVVTREDLVNDQDMEKGIRSFGVETDEEEQDAPHFLVLPVENSVDVPSGDEEEGDGQSESISFGNETGTHERNAVELPQNPHQHHHGRMIPNNCAICLATYAQGDVVVWSANLECPHAFHEDCILQWLAIKRRPTCPCCRRNFLNSTTGETRTTVPAASSPVREGADAGIDRIEHVEAPSASPQHNFSTLQLERRPTLHVSVSFSPNANAHFLCQVIPLNQEAAAARGSISNLYDGISGESSFLSLPTNRNQTSGTSSQVPRRSA